MSCAACTVITGDLGRIVAIEIDGERARTLEENETITLVARAIDAAGDTVQDATVEWEQLDAESGFTIDASTGLVEALFPGGGRVRALVENLRSDTISIEVTGAPDSIAGQGEVRVVMASDDEDSPSLVATIIDLTTEPGTLLPLAEKDVAFNLVEPLPESAAAQGFFLTEANDTAGKGSHAVTVTTDASGLAAIVVRRIAGSVLPDSAIVDAVAVTAVGEVVSGSPVSFTVIFEHTP